MEDQEGYHIEKDPETGEITSATLTSERAKEIRAAPGKRAKRADELAEHLSDVLVDDADPRAPAMRALLHELADAAGSSGAGRTRAIEAALSLIGSRPRETIARPNKNQTCPLCGRIDLETLTLTPAAQKLLRDLLGRAAWQIVAKQHGWHEPGWVPG